MGEPKKFERLLPVYLVGVIQNIATWYHVALLAKRKPTLEKTKAANNVAAVVFDFRGFDTIGESFILLTAIAGTYVILNGYRKPKKEEDGGEA